MEKNGLILNATSSEVVSMLNPKNDRKRLYHIEGRKEFIVYSQAPVVANAVYQWSIDDDFLPSVLWVYESNVNTNRTFRWVITNKEAQKIFDVTLTASQFTVLGNTLYWEFPLAVIEEGSKAYFTSNVALTGMNVIGTLSHIDITIPSALAASLP